MMKIRMKSGARRIKREFPPIHAQNFLNFMWLEKYQDSYFQKQNLSNSR